MWSQHTKPHVWLFVVQYLDFRVLKFQSIIRLNTSPAFDPIFHHQQQQHLIQVDRLWCMFELAAFLCPGQSLERCESGMGQQLIEPTSPTASYFGVNRTPGFSDIALWLLEKGVGCCGTLKMTNDHFGAVELSEYIQQWKGHIPSCQPLKGTCGL